jgi:hypothetical protein
MARSSDHLVLEYNNTGSFSYCSLACVTVSPISAAYRGCLKGRPRNSANADHILAMER